MLLFNNKNMKFTEYYLIIFLLYLFIGKKVFCIQKNKLQFNQCHLAECEQKYDSWKVSIQR